MKINQRTFSIALTLTVILTLVAPPVFATQKAANTPPPNLLFLLCDDLQAFIPGFSGNTEIKTPHLDRLATQGVVFDRCYANSAICMPSRATIFTGMYEYKHGCNFSQPGLSVEDWKNCSYPVLLRNAGYFTGFAGKWGVQFRDKSFDPSADFDRWGALKGGQGDYRTAGNPNMAAYAKQYPHITRALGAFGRDFIREAAQTNKPFCLSISFKAPHKPHTIIDPIDQKKYTDAHFSFRPNYGDEFFKNLPPQPGIGRQRMQWKEWDPEHYQEHMRAYAALVSGVDDAVKMMLDELRAEGLLDNTIIIFTSDNGYALGSHGLQGKTLPYEESSRIPLLIVDPRGAKNARCDRLAGCVDFAPTLLDYAGVQKPLRMDGISLRPLVDNPRSAPLHAQLLLFQNWAPAKVEINKAFSIVTDRYKYIFWPYGDINIKPVDELYDIQNDAFETNELIRAGKAGPEILSDMRKRYDAAVEKIAQDSRNVPGYGSLANLYNRHIPWTEKTFHPANGRIPTPELYRQVVGKEPPPGLFKTKKEKKNGRKAHPSKKKRTKTE